MFGHMSVHLHGCQAKISWGRLKTGYLTIYHPENMTVYSEIPKMSTQMKKYGRNRLNIGHAFHTVGLRKMSLWNSYCANSMKVFVPSQYQIRKRNKTVFLNRSFCNSRRRRTTAPPAWNCTPWFMSPTTAIRQSIFPWSTCLESHYVLIKLMLSDHWLQEVHFLNI